MARIRENKNLLAVLDIGTSKVLCVVAEIGYGNDVDIIGVYEQRSAGLRKGVVVNIESTVNSILDVVREIERVVGCRITNVYASIAGSHVRCCNSEGTVPIRDREVRHSDVERVMESARAIVIPSDQQILHVLVQEFIVDGQDGVKEPLGMSGVRLEVNVHIVTGAVSAAQNIIKCVRRCGLEVSDLVLQPLASSMAVLTEDDRNLGVCLVDIGAGTTDIAVFTKGAIRHVGVLPIAGDQITNDIAMALRVSTAEAEQIKRRFGSVCEIGDQDDRFEVPGICEGEPRALSRGALAGVIRPRVEELFELIDAELRHSGYDQKIAAGGIVLTGGTSLLPGIVSLCSEMFEVPVRIGLPAYGGPFSDMIASPRHATVYGLLLEAQSQCNRGEMVKSKGVIGQAVDWVKKYF